MHTRPTSRLATVGALLLLALGACSSSIDEVDGPAAAPADADDGAADGTTAVDDGADDANGTDGADDEAGDDDTSAATDDAERTAGGDGADFLAVDQYVGEGTGTVTFADGTELSTPITCTIGQRELAGRELLYTATASGDVQFDMTIYGDGGAVDSVVLNVTGADGQRSSAGGPLAAGPFGLTEVGPTMAGSGTFKPGHAGDTGAEGEPREGDVLVECR